jgi:hypothetical protein
VKLNLFLYVYLIFWVISILEFKAFLADTDYPTSKISRASTSKGKILYPWVYMGNPTGICFLIGRDMEYYYTMSMYLLPSLIITVQTTYIFYNFKTDEKY